MPNFRRYYIPDAIVFITGVTYDRVPFSSQPTMSSYSGIPCDASKKFTLFIFWPTSSCRTISTG